MKCEYCGKQLPQDSKAKYCDDVCKQAAYRERVSKETEKSSLKVKTVRRGSEGEMEIKSTFTPNWQRNGFASKQEAMEHIIECLFRNKKRIIDAGVSGEAVFQYGDYTVRVK
jgi:hypothetical protein